MATLLITTGPDNGSTYSLQRPTTVIGRESDCDIFLSDSKASRHHAEVLHDENDRWFIRDRGSSNGTLLNTRAISRMPEALRDGDDIQIGSSTLRFALNDATKEAPNTQESASETIIQHMAPQGLPLLKDEESEGVSALRFLLDLAREAEETDNPAALAEVLSDGLAGAVDADRVFLFVGKDENMRPVERKMPKHLARIYAQDYSSSVISKAAIDRVAVLSRINEDDRFRDAVSVEKSRITSAICVPLIASDELLGAIYLDRLNQEAPFSSGDLELATAAGIQCSMALLNIRRLADLRTSRDNLEVELTGPLGFIGESSVVKKVYDFIQRVAPTDAGVLINGESGTGKELIARAIHKSSPRVDRPLVIVNCAALAESLAEAELFGHERGAFTGADKSRPGRFAAADGGTIFLDEIGELTEPIQAKLLRVLESGEITPVGEAGARHVDVRVVAATNRDLAKEAEAGRFRRDLYFRLNILRIELPPLRERGEDIKLLIEHFVQFFGKRCGRPNLKVGVALMKKCLGYSWPGNVRELRNAVERMVILAQGDELGIEDLPPEVSGNSGSLSVGVGELRPLADVERDHILGVLEKAGGNKKKTAEILEIDRSTLYAKLKSYGDESDDSE